MLRELLDFKIISFDSLRDELIQASLCCVHFKCGTEGGSAERLVQGPSKWPRVQPLIPLQCEDSWELASSRKAQLCLRS